MNKLRPRIFKKYINQTDGYVSVVIQTKRTRCFQVLSTMLDEPKNSSSGCNQISVIIVIFLTIVALKLIIIISSINNSFIINYKL